MKDGTVPPIGCTCPRTRRSLETVIIIIIINNIIVVVVLLLSSGYRLFIFYLAAFV